MSEFKIGILSDAFNLSTREGLTKAREMGADGVQVNAVDGEISPEEMDREKCEDFKRFYEELGIEISALCGDLGGHGFQLSTENEEKIPRSKKIVDLAADLGTTVVTSHIGVIPEDESSETYKTMLSACREIAVYAASRCVRFAVETGPEPAERLHDFLIRVDSPGMGVNLDPANLVMVLGCDPIHSVDVLKEFIVHTHAKDGVHLKDCDPKAVYDSFAVRGLDGFPFGEYFNETPLGEGSINWNDYLDKLKEVGYQGYLTIERETGPDPEGDIRKAVGFLRETMDRVQTA